MQAGPEIQCKCGQDRDNTKVPRIGGGHWESVGPEPQRELNHRGSLELQILRMDCT